MISYFNAIKHKTFGIFNPLLDYVSIPKIVISIMGMNANIFLMFKRTWGAPTDGRCYGNIWYIYDIQNNNISVLPRPTSHSFFTERDNINLHI